MDYDHSVTRIRARRTAASTYIRTIAPIVVAVTTLGIAGGPLRPESADEETPSAPAVELIPPRGPALGLATVMALACDEDVHEVGFWVDGRFVGADDSPPFEVEADFGAAFEPHTVRARAVDRHQVVVGEATLELNTGGAVLVTELEQVDGRVELRASAPPNSPTPTGYRVFAGDTQLAARRQPNLDLAVSREQLDGARLLRVTAEYDDGSSLERYLPVRDGFTEAVDVNEVRLWVTVTDRKGEPVLDLPPNAFAINGDGWIDHEPVIVRPEAEPLSLALILDGSDSMSGYRDALRESAEVLATELLGDGDRLLLFDVSDRPRLLNPTGDPEAAVEMLDEWVDGGGSALYDSLYFGLRRVAATDGRKALVLLSDGADLHSHLDTERVTDLAWRQGIPVFLVATTTPYRGVERLQAFRLRRFVESTGGRVFTSGSAAGQRRAIETILELMRRPYVLRLSGDGSRDLTELRDMSVDLPDPKMEARVFLGQGG